MGTEVTTDDVLEAIHDHPDPAVTAPELGERLPCVSRTVNNRLAELVAAGDVEKKKVGGRAAIYWLPGTRKPRLDAPPRERALKPDQADLQSIADDGAESIKRDMVYGEENSRDSVRETIREMDLPGAGEKLEARQEALVDLYEHLRMTGEAEKKEFMKVLEAHDHGYASPDSYWSNVVKGKDTLQSLPGVVPPAEGNVRWRYEEQ